MPPKRKHQQQAAETEHQAAAPEETAAEHKAPEDQHQAEGEGVKEEQEAKASEEKAKEEEGEGVGQAAPSPKKEEEEDRKEEEEEEQDAPELKRRRVSFQEPQKEKEEEKGDEVVAKEEEVNKNVLQEEGEAQRFEFAWDKFTGLLEGDGAGFTGAEPNVSVCDEPVDEALVRAGLELLNAATGPWREDADEGRRRTEQVAASCSDYRDSVARVYRASSPSAGSEPHHKTDRFELTFLQCPGDAAHFEYVFLVDKVKRRYVFVGEAGAHPQAGTNDFVYDNSDGSGPGLLPDSSAPPTPTTLLDAARQRFSEFCLDHHH